MAERSESRWFQGSPLSGRFSLSPLTSRLLKGTLWSFGGAAASRAFTLIASVLTARLLGVEGFGKLGAVQSTIGMFAVFAGFGLGMTATKYVAQFRANAPDRAGRVIALSEIVGTATGVTMTALLLLGAPWLASRTLAAASLSPLLQLGSSVLLFGSIAGVQSGALAGLEAFRTAARVNLFTGLASAPLGVALAYWGGVHGAVAALVISLAINCALNHHALRTEARRASIDITHHGCFQEGRILWTFSLPAVFSGLMIGPVYWACSVLLVNLPNGYAEMGIFNAVNQWFVALQFLPTVLGQAALPLLSQQFGGGDGQRFRRLLMSAIAMNAVVMIPVVLLGAAFSPLIMRSYGPAFGPEWPTLIMVLLAAGISALLSPVGHVIAASSRMWLGALMNAGWGLIFLGSAAVLIHYGAFGVASARVIAYVIHGVWTLAFAVYIFRKAHDTQP